MIAIKIPKTIFFFILIEDTAYYKGVEEGLKRKGDQLVA